MFYKMTDYELYLKVYDCIDNHWQYVRNEFEDEYWYPYFKKSGVRKASGQVLRNIMLLKEILFEDNYGYNTSTKVLVVGLGTGKMAVVLNKLGFYVEGIDDDAGGKRTSEILNRRFPNFYTHVSELEKGQFNCKSDNFDLVISTDVIEHLPGSPKRYLRGLFRVLRDGGHLMLSDPNPSSIAYVLKIISGRTPYPDNIERWFDVAGTGYYQGHWREYTPSELKYMTEEVGFVTLKCGSRVYYADSFYKNVLISMILTPIVRVLSALDICECGRDSYILSEK